MNLKPGSTIDWIYLDLSLLKVKVTAEQGDSIPGAYNFLRIDSIEGSISSILQDQYVRYWEQTQSYPNQDVLLLHYIDSLAILYPDLSLIGNL
jgi:hypothetical protein